MCPADEHTQNVMEEREITAQEAVDLLITMRHDPTLSRRDSVVYALNRCTMRRRRDLANPVYDPVELLQMWPELRDGRNVSE